MATRPLGADSAHVITPHNFPPAAAARIAARMLDRFNRDELGNAIEVLVELLDVWDGDPDSENCGSEDDPIEPYAPYGPGCPIADAGGGDVTDEPHDGYEEDGL